MHHQMLIDRRCVFTVGIDSLDDELPFMFDGQLSGPLLDVFAVDVLVLNQQDRGDISQMFIGTTLLEITQLHQDDVFG